MNLEERLKYFKEKGYTYDPETGNIISNTNKIVGRNAAGGYLRLTIQYYKKINNKYLSVYSHQLAYYLYYNEVPNVIDHINHNKKDNRIINLRSVTQQINTFNNNAKGYYLDKRNNKYRSVIMINQKNIHLGVYNTSEEAHQAYLDAKKIYHIIE